MGFGILLVALCGFASNLVTPSTWLQQENFFLPVRETVMTKGESREEISEDDESPGPLNVFSQESFYRQRSEPEEVLVGILQAAPVREGPNTRDMPFKLVVGTETYSVYVAGFDHAALLPFVGCTVKVIGKRIDQRAEGYGIEIWIATLRRHKP